MFVDINSNLFIMKNTCKNLLKSLLIPLLLIASSCSTEEIETVDTNVSHLPKDILVKAKELNIKPEKLGYQKIESSDGQYEELVIVSGDIAYKKNRFLNIPIENGEISKQYRTEFIVDTDTYRTINIYAYTGPTTTAGVGGLSQKAKSGLERAIANWNNAGSKIKFDVTYGSTADFPSKDPNIEITIFVLTTITTTSGSLGIGISPSEDGAPGSILSISEYSNSLSDFIVEDLEDLFTHELGHTIGFRHTDWKTRGSCGGDPKREDEAIHILGSSPTWHDDPISIMNACGNVSNELSAWDTAAVRILYP